MVAVRMYTIEEQDRLAEREHLTDKSQILGLPIERALASYSIEAVTSPEFILNILKDIGVPAGVDAIESFAQSSEFKVISQQIKLTLIGVDAGKDVVRVKMKNIDREVTMLANYYYAAVSLILSHIVDDLVDEVDSYIDAEDPELLEAYAYARNNIMHALYDAFNISYRGDLNIEETFERVLNSLDNLMKLRGFVNTEEDEGNLHHYIHGLLEAMPTPPSNIIRLRDGKLTSNQRVFSLTFLRIVIAGLMETSKTWEKVRIEHNLPAYETEDAEFDVSALGLLYKMLTFRLHNNSIRWETVMKGISNETLTALASGSMGAITSLEPMATENCDEEWNTIFSYLINLSNKQEELDKLGIKVEDWKSTPEEVLTLMSFAWEQITETVNLRLAEEPGKEPSEIISEKMKKRFIQFALISGKMLKDLEEVQESGKRTTQVAGAVGKVKKQVVLTPGLSFTNFPPKFIGPLAKKCSEIFSQLVKNGWVNMNEVIQYAAAMSN